MEKEMKELYIEGLATHDDPESCVGARKDAGEALTGARAGRAIEPRNPLLRGADAVDRSGRPHHWSRYRKLPVDPARSENPGMHEIFMRENREIPCPLNWAITRWAAQARPRP
jgi:hypothetical protein